tara:strand:- start:714 stop:986 length:273 start_codon:yes stop_codon:yes gene_type:complete
MSNAGIERYEQRIVDEIYDMVDGRVLTLSADLLEDCLNYVQDNYMYYYEHPSGGDVPSLVIRFLSTQCLNTITNKELTEMAKHYEESSCN